MKEEAAGKVRVFAMVDAWTQWVMKPIHDLMFFILKDIPMDGTFDQPAPLKRVKAVRGLWSLDLSAATDRLPIEIQKELLAHLLKDQQFAEDWAAALVNRDYKLRIDENHVITVRYEVGQPMGAYSSWALLAFTHHFLVQAAAWRAGFPRWKLYTNYAILGDDVVIGDSRVATQYLLIMASLGVGVNTAKSLLSPRGTALEFAKRTIVRGVDVSPVSFKEFYSATRSLGAFQQLRKKTNISLAEALQALGAGWQVRSWLNKPLGKLSARVRLIILSANIPMQEEDVAPFFAMGQCPSPRHRVDSQLVVLHFIQKEITRLFAKVHQLAPLSLGGEASSDWALRLAKGIALNELKLDLPSSFAFEEDPSWYTDLGPFDLGTTEGIVHELARGLRLLLHMIRVNQTRQWKTDLNRLATSLWELMELMDNPKALPEGATFSKVYIQYLEALKELSAFSREVLAESRPNPKGMEGIMNPAQVRLWKRWSQLLQGSKGLDPLFVDAMALQVKLDEKVRDGIEGTDSAVPAVIYLGPPKSEPVLMSKSPEAPWSLQDSPCVPGSIKLLHRLFPKWAEAILKRRSISSSDFDENGNIKFW
jgi:hypothetical protein